MASREQVVILLLVLVVVIDFLIGSTLVQRGEKVNHNGVTTATVCLDARLNDLNRRPISVGLVPEHNIAKELSIEYFHILLLLFVILVLAIPEDGCVLLPLCMLLLFLAGLRLYGAAHCLGQLLSVQVV